MCHAHAVTSSSSWRALGAVLAALLVLAGCGDSDDDGSASDAPTTTASPTGGGTPLDVATVTERFVDTSRPTAAGAETPAAPDRTIVTRIVHPTGGGPYPLLVMSHGATGHPDEYA